MALTHLVDTSVLSRLREPLVADRVVELLRTRSAAITSLSSLEVGFSARSAKEFDALLSALDVYEVVETTEADLVAARDVQRALAALGKRGRKVPDLVIAAVARRNGLTVLHYDRDFEFISTVTGQRDEWVVAPGTVD